ncbi:MAG TPA: CRISPR-associated endonuclease Cas1 [Gammaproteobacteria bacterium]|nr:CRISPR-associated endonuclease Cas1 [Gammaproteobacteria bacterium]
MILVIDRKNSVLRHQAGCLLIEQPGKPRRRAPLSQIEQVIIQGNPVAETAVWRALSDAGVPTVMLPTRGKGAVAMLGAGLATQLPLRRLQHRLADRPQAALALARWFIGLKLQSQDLSLSALDPDAAGGDDIDAFRAQRDEALIRLPECRNIDAVMGLEGQTARGWFALLARRLPYCWKFSGRNRRPPRDPVNALLSLGYTLMQGDVRQVLIGSGLDPSLGFLHQDYPGREALALDFTEIFRSGIDCFVIQLLTRDQAFDNASFYYRAAEGCRLSKAARPLFFKAWAQYRENWPRPIAEEKDWRKRSTAPLREQIGGQIALVREYMKQLEKAQ